MDQFQKYKFQEYKQKKNQHSKGQMSQEERVKAQLRKLPKGKNLMNWICQQTANKIGEPVYWKYVDQNEATQKRSRRIEFMKGEEHERLLITEVNRREIAQTRAAGESWIKQFMAAMNGSSNQGSASQMHEKFEEDLSDRFGDMMDKITGND